jgi:hypothetical protein
VIKEGLKSLENNEEVSDVPMDRIIERKDQFLENMKRKFDTKEKDANVLKAKPIKMDDLDIANAPKRMSVGNVLNMPSVRPKKHGENPLHGGTAKFES